MTHTENLKQLESREDFIHRHIGPDESQIRSMLKLLGLDCLEQIISVVVPDSVVSPEPLTLKNVISERAVRSYLRKLRNRNQVFTSLIGMGYHGALMPAVIQRNVLENPAWYTAYTPYQAEISQGRLEALINFQQMILDLTGMDLANASMLDEATAAAEAMAMSRRLVKHREGLFFVDSDCHPQTLAVVETRARSLGIELLVGNAFADLDDQLAGRSLFGLLVQYPGSSGQVRDLTELAASVHAHQALLTVAADPLALVLLRSPGAMGADIAVGSVQRFGLSMGFGGPHAAYFATRDAYKRSLPGRIIGVSTDSFGQPAYRLALQTREQHIRRDKATSNICTAQVLLAVLASFYAVYHGPEGLRRIAGRVHRQTRILGIGLKQLGFDIEHQHYFDTLKVHAPNQARRLAARARASGINLRIFDADALGISLDETTTRETLRSLLQVFSPHSDYHPDVAALDEIAQESGLPAALLREDAILSHPVFSQYQSESEMMRYMRRLARKDIALDRSMIPLGSCTMKLNAATELQALSYREFAAMHPFAPLEQAQGYLQLLNELEEMLCDVTGFDAFSFQPNAGSQGEYTGLLVIRKFLHSCGQGHRDICLIPASAHGTNPASAVMAGLRVVVVACDAKGNVDVDDLSRKASEHTDHLAALMITYPSTHGVFEEAFVDMCQIIHDHGGQVYMDGANFNALVGICRPAHIGVDVAHLNLHKTFAIPHGGGGPGAGPIGVRNHLSPFLPDHPVVEGVNPAAGPLGTVGAVSAAPWGSASILSISWAYIAMMRNQGLKRATLVAILSANYIARRLSEHYPILYSGRNGYVAHECIIDLRPIKKACGITVDDIAKRLIDYGFHAPTMSFPVADTMMIEPTESENKRELDRFCDALIAIRGEISAIESGDLSSDNNPLVNAPHTHLLLRQDWPYPYSMQTAFFPLPGEEMDKYWPPVARIDNRAGDKALICTCPPLSSYQE